jgi:putative membrane protein
MARLTDSERQQLRDAVRDAEAGTRAEFVVVIARRADPYFFPPLLLATAAALLTPAILWLTGWAIEFPALYGAQLAVFAILASALRIPVILDHLIPASVGSARARRLAHEIFHRLGLHRTRGRTGVLLFVSLAEHYVEILADDAADDAVPPDTWSGIVTTMTEQVRAGGRAAGLQAALTQLGTILAQSLPRESDDINEIPDRLIEL